MQKAKQHSKKKGLKIFLGFLIAIVIILGLSVGAIAVYNQIELKKPDSATQAYLNLAEQYTEISYDEESGVAYVNNEIIVIAKEDVDVENVKAMLKKHKATITNSMDDIGVYKVGLDSALDLSELEKKVNKIKSEDIVDDAYINTIILLEEDGFEMPEGFDFKSTPKLPNDPWETDNEDWDSLNPSGNNWGLEAVDAMGAWGYAEYMETVNIGVIDTIPNFSHEDLTFVKAAIADSNGNIIEFDNNDDFSPVFHCMHVSGTMAAEWNETGVSGIMMDKANLYYCGVGGSSEDYYTTPYSYFAAIKYLVDQDVRAINISQHTNRLLGFAASKGNEKAKKLLEKQANTLEGLLKRYVEKREKSGEPDFVICMSAGNSNNIGFYKSSTSTYGYTEHKLIGGEAKRGGSFAKYNNYINLMDDKTVLDRIIVVGSAKMEMTSDGSVTYSYSAFSCVGDRVDVAAPGEDIWSCTANGYEAYAGTSMAAPHVTSAAGLIFASNPSLSGKDVKAIIKNTTTGKFVYDGGTCGLLNINNCVVSALASREVELNQIVHHKNSGLDICFVIDTTGSMGDDIDNAKANMSKIIASMSAKTSDYRVAIVDYRDFPERGGDEDYPAKVQLDFTNDDEKITNAIEDLNLGFGGDEPETVYSGIMTALSLDWRTDAEKIIIVLGDAPPLDPEPNTGYTYEQILCALYNADVNVGEDEYKDWTGGEGDDYLVNVFTIETNAYGAGDFFADIADSTGGVHTQVDSADEVSDAIVNSIDKIEVAKTVTVKTPFGEDYSGEKVDVYLDDEYYFSFVLDEEGSCTIKDIEPEKYTWKIERLNVEGELNIGEKKKEVQPEFEKEPWYNFALDIWYRHRVELIVGVVSAIIVIILLIIFIIKLKKFLKKQKEERIAKKAEQERLERERYNQMIANQNAIRAAAQQQAQPPQEKKEIFCPQCGSKNPVTVKFCGKCGTPFPKND